MPSSGAIHQRGPRAPSKTTMERKLAPRNAAPKASATRSSGAIRNGTVSLSRGTANMMNATQTRERQHDLREGRRRAVTPVGQMHAQETERQQQVPHREPARIRAQHRHGRIEIEIDREKGHEQRGDGKDQPRHRADAVAYPAPEAFTTAIGHVRRPRHVGRATQAVGRTFEVPRRHPRGGAIAPARGIPETKRPHDLPHSHTGRVVPRCLAHFDTIRQNTCRRHAESMTFQSKSCGNELTRRLWRASWRWRA